MTVYRQYIIVLNPTVRVYNLVYCCMLFNPLYLADTTSLPDAVGSHDKTHKRQKRRRNRDKYSPYGGPVTRSAARERVYSLAKPMTSDLKFAEVSVAQSAWIGSRSRPVEPPRGVLSLQDALALPERLQLLKWNGMYVYFIYVYIYIYLYTDICLFSFHFIKHTYAYQV